MTGAELIAAAKNATALAQFISDGGLEAAIATVVGDIHTDAAKLALSMSSTSNSPSDRVRSAITHLEAAHVAYRTIVESAMNSWLGPYPRVMKVAAAANKNAWVCSLMAVCYAHLGDAPAVARSIEMAREARKCLDAEFLGEGKYSKARDYSLGWLLFMSSPDNWITLAKIRNGGGPPQISSAEINSLASRLDGVMKQ